jgi:hypothetical protein
MAREITPEDLYAEVSDLLRTMPPHTTMGNGDTVPWLGRAVAVMDRWDPYKGIAFQLHVRDVQSNMVFNHDAGYGGVMLMLNQAHYDLKLATAGPVNVAIEVGLTFHYFEEVRQLVDPYLDAEFVSRYLVHVKPQATIRLLTSNAQLAPLLAAVDAFAQQRGDGVEVRTAKDLHDRYVIIDGSACYQSGASFKDGAKRAATTLTQITDAFAAVRQTYEKNWATAHVAR